MTDDIDRRIREALQAEDAELFDRIGGGQSLVEQMVHSFTTRSKWLVTVVLIYIVVFFALMIFTAIQFFQAQSTHAMIGWAAGFLFCSVAVAMSKIWYWMELNKNALTRELKRLELAVAHLARQVK
jgi:hypothetical protein